MEKLLSWIGYSVKVEVDGRRCGLSFNNTKTVSRTLRIEEETGRLYVIIEDCTIYVEQKFYGSVVDVFVAQAWSEPTSEDQKRLDMYREIYGHRKQRQRKTVLEKLLKKNDVRSEPTTTKEMTDEEFDTALNEFDTILDDLQRDE